MSIFLQDLRCAARWMKKAPGVSLLAIATLALAIGANTAIFSVMNAVVMQPLPYQEPGQLVQIWETGDHSPRVNVSGENFVDWRNQNKTFARMALFNAGASTVFTQGTSVRATGVSVTEDFFKIFNVNAIRGRVPEGEDFSRSSETFLVLSDGLSHKLFGAAGATIGATARIDGRPCVIVGVLPTGFEFPEKAEFWMPLRNYSGNNVLARSAKNYSAVGRLKPGVTLEEANTDLGVIGGRIASAYPDLMSGTGIRAIALHEQVVGHVRPVLVIFLCAVICVLLIACVNVANLLLARAHARSKEIALRTALGANRWRIIRQLLTESLLLSSLGGAVGLAVLALSFGAFKRFIPANFPRAEQIHIDAQVVLYTLLITLFTSLVFGILPALTASRLDLNETLKGSGLRTNAQRLGGWLVTGEIAAALLLLVGAGLMIKSLWKLDRVDIGYNPERIYTARLSLPTNGLPQDQTYADAAHNYVRQIVARVAAIPGVERAATINSLLRESMPNSEGGIEGRSVGSIGKPSFYVWHADFQVVSPGFFETLGVPMLRGRSFTEHDDERATPVMIINDAAAHKFWPGQDPIGQRVIFPGNSKTQAWVTIVGVSADIRQHSLDRDPVPAAYTPHAQNFYHLTYLTLVARVRGEDTATAEAIRRQIQQVSDELPTEVEPAQVLIAESVARQRFQMQLLVIFAALAIVLAGIGVFGLLSYVVENRTREIGIRMALGAQREDVLWLFLERGMRFALLGIVIGAVASLGLTRLISTYLFHVAATDPMVFSATACLLFVVALLATYVPAQRASTADPMISLRYD